MNRLSRRPASTVRLSAFTTAALAGLALAAGGCSSTPRGLNLTLTPRHGNRAWSQQFTEGYVGRGDHGDADVVLACSANHPAGHAGELRQVMHIRVAWDSAVALAGAGMNASIRWYVFTEHGDRTEMIEYTGVGKVSLEASGPRTLVTIRDATLDPTFSAGALHDPIGATRFTGVVAAVPDQHRLDELLSSVNQAVAATSPAPALQDARTADARDVETR